MASILNTEQLLTPEEIRSVEEEALRRAYEILGEAYMVLRADRDDVLVSRDEWRKLAIRAGADRDALAEALRWIAAGRTGSYGSAQEFAKAVLNGSGKESGA